MPNKQRKSAIPENQDVDTQSVTTALRQYRGKTLWEKAPLLFALFLLSFSLAYIPEALFGDPSLTAQSDVYADNSGLVYSHLVTDLLIGLSYVAISGTLVYLAWRARRSIPFLWAFIAFGAFIVACGITHFMSTWTLWAPAYYLAGGVKFITAAVSVATAVMLPSLVPKVLGLIRVAENSESHRREVEATNRKLGAANRKLKEQQRELEKVNKFMVGRENRIAELKERLKTSGS